MPFTGTGSTQGTSVLRVLWKSGTPDRICYLLKHTQANLTSTVTIEDDAAMFGDTGLDIRARYVDLLRVRNADTYVLVVNGITPTPTILTTTHTSTGQFMRPTT